MHAGSICNQLSFTGLGIDMNAQIGLEAPYKGVRMDLTRLSAEGC
jgi:hypothetical protein